MVNKVWGTIISVFVLLVLDAAYIYTIKDGYMSIVKNVQGGYDAQINVYAAVLSYIFVVLGLVLYVLPYAEKMKLNIDSMSVSNKIYISVVGGALFGAVVYGVYNTTNMALFKDFSFSFALFDIVWGSFLYFTATLIYLLIVK